MNKKKIIIAIVVFVIVLIAVLLVYIKTNNIQKDNVVKAISKQILKIDGLEFKDLNSNGQLDIYEDWRKTTDERAENLISQMTLEEKAGLILINTQPMGIDKKDIASTSHDGIIDESETSSEHAIYMNKVGTTKTIKDLNIRHIILRTTHTAEEMAKWCNTVNEIAEETRLGIPVVITSNSRNELNNELWDYDDSTFTMYPGTLGIAAADLGEKNSNQNSKIVENFAETVKKEWKAIGIRKGYMYMADISTDPRWMRIYGTFGEDPQYVSEVMTKLVKGIQGEELNQNGVALTMKHFPGSGATVNGMDAHFELGRYGEYRIENSFVNYHLKPFEAAITAGVSSIMPYYSQPSPESAKQVYKEKEISMSGAAYAFNSNFLNNLLRDQMNFKGYVNTDSGVIDFISWGEENRTETERMADALNAGTNLISDSNRTELVLEAYNNKLITQETLDNSCKVLLKEMFRLGLFENPYVEIENLEKEVTTQESINDAYLAHLKSVTLLKNKDNILPIKTNGEEKSKVYIKFLGIFSDYTSEKKSIEKIKEINDNIEIVEDYGKADYAIIYLKPNVTAQFGSNNTIATLSVDNTTLGGNLDIYNTICDKVHENNGKVITVVNFTNPWIVTNVETKSDALLGVYNTYIKAWYDVIMGKFNPTGVLPYTLPASEDVVKIDENGKCISPNDVPGYDKNQYLPEGMNYEYTDELGNKYTLKYGLTY